MLALRNISGTKIHRAGLPVDKIHIINYETVPMYTYVEDVIQIPKSYVANKF